METSETKQNRAASAVIQTAVILFGLTVYAAGVVLFILPLDMIAAGTTGLGLMAQHFFGIPLSGFVAVFNIIMFGLGWLELGKKFAATTLLATFYYPFILDRLTALAGDFVFTTDPILCAIFAGIMIGFALGFVIRSGASTGGMDIPPLVLQKRFKFPVSVSMYVFDVAILLSQLLFRDRENDPLRDYHGHGLHRDLGQDAHDGQKAGTGEDHQREIRGDQYRSAGTA